MPTAQERRAATLAMTKCQCGNVARQGGSLCGRCADQADAVDLARNYVDSAVEELALALNRKFKIGNFLDGELKHALHTFAEAIGNRR